jgi:purine-binding chemotaxis protein CheW
LIFEKQVIGIFVKKKVSNKNQLLENRMEGKELLETIQYLAFRLENEVFAFDISKVREVLEFDSITKVPQTPDMMKGVINLRGAVVPVVDMRIKFGMSETEKTVNTVIIIIEIDLDGTSTMIGALVDSVKEVIDLDSEHIEPPPKIGTKLNTEYIKGMGKQDNQFLIILDIEKVFSSDELDFVQQASDQVPA